MGKSILDFSNYDVGVLQPRELTIKPKIKKSPAYVLFTSPTSHLTRENSLTPPSWPSAAVAAGDTHTDSSD